MNLKQKVSQFIFKAGISPWFRQMQNDQIFIFNYHRIRDDNFKSEFDEAVFGPTASDFKKHMLWLKNNFNIWSEQDFLNCKVNTFNKGNEFNPHDLLTPLNQPKLVLKPIAAITFDDGYEDNYRLAWPILKELEIPGIFFIPTQAVESRLLSWWDQISYIIKHSKQAQFTFRGQHYKTGHSAPLSSRAVTALYRGASATEVIDFIPELLFATQSVLPTTEKQSEQIMTWDQIVEISNSGYAIGAHTHTHKILSQLSLQEQKNELQMSKIILEKKISKKINSFAYPCGQYEHFNLETKKLLEELNYQLGFSFLTGQLKTSHLDFYDLRRIWPQSQIEMFEMVTGFPQFLIKNQSRYTAPIAHKDQFLSLGVGKIEK